MNIEDVKHMSDKELNIKLSVLTGYTAKIEEKVIERGWDVEEYKNDIFYVYTANLQNAREAQAKAIEVDKLSYLHNLLIFCGILEEDLKVNQITVRTWLDEVSASLILQASPRQIAMAAYIALQGGAPK